MGKMESENAAKVKRTKIRDVVLLSLYGVGALTLAMAAPNAVRLLKYVEPEVAKKRRADFRVKEAFGRLVRSGLIRKNAAGKYTLSEQGRKHAEKLRLMSESEKGWDGKWRIVMFDVWERRRKVRNRLRQLLSERGFIRLQDSVWVYPHACEELIVLLRAELKLGGALVYVIADSIDIEKRLKHEFGFPS